MKLNKLNSLIINKKKQKIIKKFFPIVTVVALFVFMALSSCQKQDITSDSDFDGLDPKRLELIDNDYEIDGDIGELYLYYSNTGESQRIFVSKTKAGVEWEHTTTENPDGSITCNGPALDCSIYIDGDGVTIRKKNLF